MAHRGKGLGILRDRTPAERREQMAMLTLGGIYCAVYWLAVGVQIWRLWSP